MTYSDFSVAEERAIYRASQILLKKLRKPGAPVSNPHLARQYFTMMLAPKLAEEFHVAFLDYQNNLIESRCLFVGTIGHTPVYPREVVRHVVMTNASAVILAHNHPSGCLEPSAADIALTGTLKSALKLIDVTVLDHIICGPSGVLSMAERGLV